jgi:predicted lactoylglutathione lyase
MTSKEIVNAVKSALREFGTYQFSDKGAQEVMDVSEIVDALNAMPVEECVAVMESVYHSKGKHQPYAQMLVEELVLSMQDVDNSRWEVLMASPVLCECY